MKSNAPNKYGVYCLHDGCIYEVTAATYPAARNRLIHIIGGMPNGKTDYDNDNTVCRGTRDADRGSNTADAQSQPCD